MYILHSLVITYLMHIYNIPYVNIYIPYVTIFTYPYVGM